LKLNQLGVDNNLAYKIYGYYEEKTFEIIHENPYQLIQEVENVGFTRADLIADHLDIAPDADERIQAGILYAMYLEGSSSGDTYVIENHLISETVQMLEKSRPFIIDQELVVKNLESLIEDGAIFKEEGRYFLASVYHAEWGIVSSLEYILDAKSEPISNKVF